VNKVNISDWLMIDIAFLMRNGYRIKRYCPDLFAVKNLNV